MINRYSCEEVKIYHHSTLKYFATNINLRTLNSILEYNFDLNSTNSPYD